MKSRESNWIVLYAVLGFAGLIYTAWNVSRSFALNPAVQRAIERFHENQRPDPFGIRALRRLRGQ